MYLSSIIFLFDFCYQAEVLRTAMQNWASKPGAISFQSFLNLNYFEYLTLKIEDLISQMKKMHPPDDTTNLRLPQGANAHIRWQVAV